MTKSQYIKKHNAVFRFSKDANKYLRAADAFLDHHPEILYWTERNNSKAGLFYTYANGLYSPVSALEIEHLLMSFTPEEPDIVIPLNLSQCQRQEIINNIMRRRFFYRDKFNPEGIVNFKNGFFDVKKGKLFDHTMDIISTNQLPYEYDSGAECPCFMKALTDAVDDDLPTMSVIQEFAGYCLTRETKYDKALFLVGSAGSGKSTVINGIVSMLGTENVSNLSMSQLCQPRYAGQFVNKLANIDREIPRDVSAYEDPLKKIISGEEITVDTKFIPSYNAKPFCKIIFAANDMPKIADSSDGIYRRMILIYFNNVVSRENMDRNLRERVKDEGAGIFNWAYEGLKRLSERGDFSLTDKIYDNVEGMKLQNNAVYYFINECFFLDQGDNYYISVDALFSKYVRFCKDIEAKGIYKKPMFSKEIHKVFGKRIKSGQRWVDGKNMRVWTGLREKSSIEMQGGLEWQD